MDNGAAAKTLGPTEKKDLRKVRAIVIPVKKKTEDAVSSIDESKMEQLYQAEICIRPPFDPLLLASLDENNSELRKIYDGMGTNTVGHGWALHPIVNPDDQSDAVDLPESLKEEIEIEWETMNEFLSYGNWDDGSFTQVRRQQRHDLEAVGWKALEIITNARGRPIGYRHVPAFRVRIGKTDPEPTIYTERHIVGRGPRRRIRERKRARQFRRYLHLDDLNNELMVTWFKEWGDPRPISRSDGTVLSGNDAKDPKKLANPMIFRRIYAPRTPYGIPRYMGNFLSILGSRAAESINFTTFSNNQVPSMLLLVSNGQLTTETIERLTEFSQSNIQGEDNRSKFVIVEAEPDPVVGDQMSGQVRIEVEKLIDVQEKDARFTEYEESNAKKLRGSWRITPLQTGDIADFTKASGEIARLHDEEQVFAPERREEDWDWNNLLVSMGMVHHEFRTNSPNVTNDENLIAAMVAAEKSGAMTPRLARMILSDILGRELPGIDESETPLDKPYSQTMAEAVKNQARPEIPGQQVTAVKAEDFKPEEVRAIIKRLLELAGQEDTADD